MACVRLAKGLMRSAVRARSPLAARTFACRRLDGSFSDIIREEIATSTSCGPKSINWQLRYEILTHIVNGQEAEEATPTCL